MHKAESTTSPITAATLPERLTLPLHQHIGASSKPLVKIGDHVLKGQRLAQAEGYVSVALHAPSSGTVIDIGEYPVPHPSGLSDTSIVLATDGDDRWTERQPESDYLDMDPSHLRNLVREAGIVGLGGAGFPSFIKLNPGTRKAIDTLIINGIECEPYITCDDMLMRERAEEAVAGIGIIAHALQAKEVIVAIEDNKPEAFEAMQTACDAAGNIETVLCPTIYPQGSEKQLIYVVTGKEVPSDGLPLHIGVVVHNVATAAAVYRAIVHGEPLISRIVTVTGGGVRESRNMDVLIGTSINDVLEQCGGTTGRLDRLIMGGPMMGFALHTATAPVIKTTNCILAATPADLPRNSSAMPCIRCGACADACPVQLLPQQLYWYTHAKDFEKVQDHHLFDCIECGCCAYVCPSNIPLVHYYRYAKTEIWSKEREKEKADLARNRHEFRLERLEREKLERASRHKKKRKELETEPSLTAEKVKGTKKAAILAAMERAQAKKAATELKPKNVENLTDEQQEMIEEVDKRRTNASVKNIQ